jgi:hypothetical protein
MVQGKSEPQWRVMEEKRAPEASADRKGLRYDISLNGNFSFAIFRWSKVYDVFRRLCPPESRGEVSQALDHIRIKSVFPLLHCEEEFLRLKNATSVKDDLHKELSAIILLYDREGPLLDARNKYKELLETQKIDFESLNGLFRRDQLVVFRELRDEWAVGRVSMVNESYRYENKLSIAYDRIDYDGKHFRYVVQTKEIDKFSGVRGITELAVYPLEYHEGKINLMKRLIKCGSKWKDLHAGLRNGSRLATKVMQYSGYCQTFAEDPVGRSVSTTKDTSIVLVLTSKADYESCYR